MNVATQTVKTCKRCKVEKSTECFTVSKACKDGLDIYCRDCKKAYAIALKAKDPGCFGRYSKKYNDKNKDKRKAYRQKYRDKGREYAWAHKLMQNYGITPEQYYEMLDRQNGVCAICSQPETKKWDGETIRLAVDHCHKTNHIRGLLCFACNIAIGFLGDDFERVRKAADYLIDGGVFGRICRYLRSGYSEAIRVFRTVL
jgi:hypothetical protein